MGKLAQHGPILLIGDANAKVQGSVDATAGTYGAEETDVAGHRLLQLCADCGCCLANTFAEVMGHVSPKTWRDKRLDYIGLPRVWMHEARAECARDFDLMNAHDDHRPVIIQCTATPSNHTYRQNHRPCLRLADPERALQAARTVAAAQVPWDLNVHVHAEKLFCSAKKAIAKVSSRHEGMVHPSWRRRDGKCHRAGARRPAKPYIGAYTAALLDLRRAQHATLQQLLHQVAMDFLSPFLSAWAGTRSQRARRAASQPGRRCLLVARQRQLLRRTAGWIRAAVRADKRLFVSRLVQDMSVDATLTDASSLYRSLRFFRAHGRKVIKPFSQLLFMRDHEGELVVDFAATQSIKSRHFGQMEAALLCDANQLAAQDEEARRRTVVEAQRVDLDCFPTLLDLEVHFRALPTSKAPGPSGIPNELWRADVPRMARTWFAPTLKTHVRLTEPVRLSTGLLVTLFKNRGSPHEVGNYRSIFLLEGVGKATRKCARQSFVDFLHDQAPPLFQGCLPSSSLAQLTQYAYTLLRVALGCGAGCSLQFVDVQSAYYSVYRPHLTNADLDDERLCQILQQLRIPASMVHEVRQWAGGAPLMADMAPHCRDYVRALFRAPSFVLAGVPQLHLSRAGTRPGDSIADVLFAMVMCDAVRELQHRLQSDGLAAGPSSTVISQPVWADDMVAPTWTPDVADLPAASAATAAHVHAVYSRRAMLINYKPGKTEVLMSFNGRGTRRIKSELLGRREFLHFPGGGGCSQHIRFCFHYMHLGTHLDATGHGQKDLQIKGAKAVAAVLPLARPVLRDDDIPWADRAKILRVLGLSMATFNVGIWHHLSRTTLRAWTNTVTALYRCLLVEDRHSGHPKYPDAEAVAGATGLPFATTLLIRERLLHWSRIVQQDRSTLWELLEVEAQICPDSWLCQITQDLCFVRYWCKDALDAAVWERILSSPTEAMVWVADNCPQLRRMLQAAITAQSASLHAWASFRKMHRNEHRQLQMPTDMAEGTMTCPLCDASFATRNALAGHLAKTHRVAKLCRQYCSGVTCPACLVNYGDHQRLIRHLSFSGAPCLAFIVAGRAPQPLAPLARASQSSHPAVRAHGPLPPKPAEYAAEILHVATESSCFDVKALQLAVASFDAELSDTLSALDCSGEVCSTLPAPPNWELMQKWKA